MDGKWTKETVEARMVEAAQTLHALRVTGLKPMGYGSNWPDIVHDPNEAYGWDDTKLGRGPPMPDAITRMDESLQWLHWLEPDQARLVWMIAENVPRKLICARVGMSRNKAWRVWSAAIMTIVSILNRNRAAVQPEESKEDAFRREYRRTGNASAAYRLAFQCDGLTSDAIQARARRLMRKHHSDGQLSGHLSKTVAKRRFVSTEPSQNDGSQ